MRPRSLLSRFVLAGCILVAATVASGLWSGQRCPPERRRQRRPGRQRGYDRSNRRVGRFIGTRGDGAVAGLGGGEAGRRELETERRHGDECYDRLWVALADSDDDSRSATRRLRQEIDLYRAAGTRLLESKAQPDALVIYHRQVNPLLRQAVGTCGTLREQAFAALRHTGVAARDEAERSTWVLAEVSLAALILASAVSIWLARSVVQPVRALTECVEAVRQGDFNRRAHRRPRSTSWPGSRMDSIAWPRRWPITAAQASASS